MKKVVACVFATVAVVFSDYGAATISLPQYKFEVGQEIVYVGSSQFNFEEGTFTNSDITRFWVTGQNKDASWHLIYVGQNIDIRTGDLPSTNEYTSLDYLDLFADGRPAKERTNAVETEAYPAFPPLPTNAVQLESGWQFADSPAVQTFYHVQQSGNQWIIKSTTQGLFRDIYQIGEAKTIFFDGDHGLVQKVESKKEQGYGFTGKGTGSVKLKMRTVRNQDWITRLMEDADSVQKAEAVEADAFRSVRNGTNAEIAKAAAKLALETAATRIHYALLKDKITLEIGSLADDFKYAEEETKRENKGIKAVINQPAATWSTTDLDGQKHSLEDYRGKVVILDFWYRGCGWCITAMPQIKTLANQFRGQPVVILGVNTDEDEKDARFVIKKLQLNYPTLHGSNIPGKYDVSAFPTFIVIDQKGVLRARHVGYSPTLGEDMAKTISGLLSEHK